MQDLGWDEDGFNYVPQVHPSRVVCGSGDEDGAAEEGSAGS